MANTIIFILGLFSGALLISLFLRLLSMEEDVSEFVVKAADGVEHSFTCNSRDYWEVRTKLVEEFGEGNVRDV